MRSLILAAVLSTASLSLAQDDPGAIANQQAIQAMQQAQQQAQQAMDDARRANEDAMRANQDAMRQTQQNTTDAQNAGPAIAYTATPSFSVKSGEVSAGTKVRLSTRTHYATIYYTTNGWTPTTSSKRYRGPITIQHTTQIQAIAIAPNMTRSLVSRATYTVPNSNRGADHAAIVTDGTLYAGTKLHLLTAGSATSAKAQIGDVLLLTLNQDVQIGDHVAIPKGTPVHATITQSDRSGKLGVPGNLAFEVDFINYGPKKVGLTGGEAIEGQAHFGKAAGIFVIPVVGLSGIAVHGDQAEIKPGMPVKATVKEDTPLVPE
jgi:hypothetical protein